MDAFEDNIEIRHRHVTWGGASGDQDWVLCGYDWSAAAFILTVRAKEGDTGTPPILIGNGAAGSMGISATYDPFYVAPDGVVTGATIIRPQIDEGTLEGLSWGTTATDQPLVLHYDLLVTPTGLPQRVFCYGTMTIYPGVGD